MIRISKEDAMYMREQGYGYCVHRCNSRRPSYYLVEEKNEGYFDKKKRKFVVTKPGALAVYNEHISGKSSKSKK